MLVALVVMPYLIAGMGSERFGLLSIIWMGVGYFSLFDLGVGRALTKMVAEHLGKGENSDLGELIWTALTLIAILGSVGGILLATFSANLVGGLLNVPVVFRDEATFALRFLALGVPCVLVTSGLVGILEAHQRFGVIASIRIPLGLLTFLGPFITMQITPSIAWATGALLCVRVLALIAYYFAAAKICKELFQVRIIKRKEIYPLIKFGGWLTVTNIVGPIMTYLDRFFISSMLGLAAVAYYCTPYEVMTRLQILPIAVMGALFPAMTVAHMADRSRLREIYLAVSSIVYWVILPVSVGALLMAPEALQIWLGAEFRDASTSVVQLLAAGLMLNTLALPAFTVLQSVGRPDLIAKAHVLELFPYLYFLWWLAKVYGISGVAAVWTLRVAVDTLILNMLVWEQIPELRKQAVKTCFVMLITGAFFCAFWVVTSWTIRIFVLLTVVLVSGIMLWFRLQELVKGWTFVSSQDS